MNIISHVKRSLPQNSVLYAYFEEWAYRQASQKVFLHTFCTDFLSAFLRIRNILFSILARTFSSWYIFFWGSNPRWARSAFFRTNAYSRQSDTLTSVLSKGITVITILWYLFFSKLYPFSFSFFLSFTRSKMLKIACPAVEKASAGSSLAEAEFVYSLVNT